MAVLSGLVRQFAYCTKLLHLRPLRQLPGTSAWRWLFLVDNAFAFWQQREQQRPGDPICLHYYAGMIVVLWPALIAFCAVGVFAGNAIPAQWELDFAIPLSFIAISATSARTGPHAGVGLWSLVQCQRGVVWVAAQTGPDRGLPVGSAGWFAG